MTCKMFSIFFCVSTTILAVFCVFTVAYAASLTVTNGNDSGAASLRKAIGGIPGPGRTPKKQNAKFLIDRLLCAI